MKINKKCLYTFLAISILLFTSCDKNSVNNSLEINIDKNTQVTEIKLYGLYTVSQVVDGDTITVDIDGKNEKVRLIGVDTPESVAFGKNAYKNCKEGKIATQFTKSQLQGKKIYLEYDIEKYDKYNRTLAYVYIDKNTMFQEMLLKQGYAQIMTVPPNSKYSARFYQLQKSARENKAGFWNDFFIK